MRRHHLFRILALGLSVSVLLSCTGRSPKDTLTLFGTVEARDIQVGSLVGGRVLEVRAEEGATVTAGETLVVFEPDLLDLQLCEQAVVRR